MSGEPKFIGRYAIESPLGRGAMGMIYRAHDPDIDRKVAIKLIRADLLDGDNRPSFIARFRREAQAAARCAHPNIVAIYDFALHEGNPFLAMEFVDGITLEQALQASTRFAPEDAVFVILQVLAALDAAHGMGIVHRDIKPANIMLVGGNLVKVTDFGISRLDTSSLTMGGVTIGTPSYMSPEQCRGETIDARSDLFSTGVVLYELLAGRKPFEGRNTAEVFARLLHEDAPDLAQACPGLPEGVRSVVARSLAKTPRDRFASAREMIAAVKTAAAEGGTVYRDRTIILPPRPRPRPLPRNPPTAPRQPAASIPNCSIPCSASWPNMSARSPAIWCEPPCAKPTRWRGCSLPWPRESNGPMIATSSCRTSGGRSPELARARSCAQRLRRAAPSCRASWSGCRPCSRVMSARSPAS